MTKIQLRKPEILTLYHKSPEVTSAVQTSVLLSFLHLLPTITFNTAI